MTARSWTQDDLHDLGLEIGVSRIGAPADRESAEKDFGRLVRRSAIAVLKPRATEEVERIIAFANARGLKLTARGRGMSQGGQSIPALGVSLDLSLLDAVGVPDVASRTMECGAGATWRAAVVACAPHGLLPKVVPLNLDLTVGGLLSVAGVGATSHRHGLAAGCVASFEAITGGGARVVCDERREPEVFRSLLGGLGRAGIITSARIELRPIKPNVRTFYLLFDAIEPWLDAQRALAKTADYLEGFCTPCIQGLRMSARGRVPFAQWFYALHVTFEHEAGRAPEAAAALAGIEGFRLLHTDDGDTVAFAPRYDGRFVAMRRSGAWELPHPWVEALLPGAKLAEIFRSILEVYPLGIGDGPRLMFVSRDRVPPFVAAPEGEDVGCCAMLPVGIAAHMLSDVLDAMREIHRRIVAAGGKRVLSGWTTMMNAADLRAHFGARADDWSRVLRQLDPNGVLDSPLTAKG